MVSLAVGGYAEDEIKRALHMAEGSREISFRYELLSKDEALLGELEDVSGHISYNSLAQIKRTGSFSIKEHRDVNFLDERIRPIFMLKMPRGWVEWPLGVLLLSSPSAEEYSPNRVSRITEAFDKCQILKEDCFTARYTIPAGAGYVDEIVKIINSDGIGKVSIENSGAVLAVAIEFEPGTSKLDAINKLLGAINYYSLTFNELGYAVSKPYKEPGDRDVEYEYRTDEISIIRHGTKQTLDIFGTPNVFVRTLSTPDRSELTSIFINDNPTSPLSTIRRGRRIVDYQIVTDISDQATLDSYTRRQAINASQIYGETIFSTALMPHHSFMDCIYLEHTPMGINNIFIETAWEMELEAGGNMQHRVRKVVQL